jgi:hypothetical protein
LNPAYLKLNFAASSFAPPEKSPHPNQGQHKPPFPRLLKKKNVVTSFCLSFFYMPASPSKNPLTSHHPNKGMFTYLSSVIISR